MAEDLERAWAKIALVIVVLIVALLGATTLLTGFHLPSYFGKADPQNLPAEFKKGMITQVSQNKYEIYMTAAQFSFVPSEIKIPKGAEVTFYITSTDVQHVFAIPGTNVNVQVFPGHINSVTYTFDKAGEYLFLCNEYCGEGHHLMSGRIMVE